MKVKNIDLAKLRGDGLFQFQTEVKDLTEKSPQVKTKIAEQYAVWKTIYARADESLKKINKSILTEQLKEADKERDQIYIRMVEMNRTALKHFNKDVQEAAKRLKIVFDTYGNINNKRLNEQTAATYSILQELETKYEEDTTIVGIYDWTIQLRTRNNKFDRLMKERFEESANKSAVVFNDARKELQKQYKLIVERINALIIVEGAAEYEQYVNMLNVIIAKYVAGIKAAAGRNAAKKK